jgi:hypothetical protein
VKIFAKFVHSDILHANADGPYWRVNTMRISILALFLCLGTMAFCQSIPSCSLSSDKPSKGSSPAPPSASFDPLQPNWQIGIAGLEKIQPRLNKNFSKNFTGQWDKAQIDPEMRFHLQLPSIAELSATPLLALNHSFPPKLFNPWPTGKAEPIPTQWPNAKTEQIPTRWPNLKMLPTVTQASTRAAAQTPAK